jgi:uncharacterized protein (TIGR04551 family)
MKIALRISTVVGLLLATASAYGQAPAAGDPKPAETKPPAKPADAAPAPADTAPPAAPGAAEATEPADAPPSAAPAPATALPPPGTATAGSSGVSLFPEPARDASALKKQGEERPGAAAASADGVFAEDWWSHARPVLELHGYFRVRAELFHHFSLARVDSPSQAMWPRPADNSYVDANQQRQALGARLCTPEEVDAGDDDDPENAIYPCKNGTQAGANLRFRLNPELHVSDNLRVMSQIDLLDNVVFGSTPGGYGNMPADGGGYAVSARDGYAPLSFFDDTQDPPSAGQNGLRDSILVKRAWAEFAMPVGEVRFGRMPNHWGLGIFLNSGDDHDDDYQSTIDRLQIVTGIKPLELYFSAAMDYPSEGATSDSVSLPNPQPYDLAQLDDVDQYTFSVARKKNPELERLALTRGDLVLNAGAMLIYRTQQLANDRTGTTASCGVGDAGAAALGCAPGTLSFVRRGATAWIPDLWLELKYKRFRFAAEALTIQGSIENLSSEDSDNINGDEGYEIEQWGLATELEQRLAEDKLRLAFNFGWASGDPDEDGLTPGRQLGDRTFETFRFHPSYNVDLILYRNILTRVQGTYFFKPSVDYDFSRDPNGQRIGGGLSIIWSRASEFIQTPGHAEDLGIELNARLYFQSKDGALNDVPDEMGGFFSKLEYGVLFPMSGLGYPSNEAAEINSQLHSTAADTNVAQTVRLYLGVFF